jgi:hypothetical protein
VVSPKANPSASRTAGVRLTRSPPAYEGAPANALSEGAT